mgnify:CR=1 FL=1
MLLSIDSTSPRDNFSNDPRGDFDKPQMRKICPICASNASNRRQLLQISDGINQTYKTQT